jgi:hypothetical protein
MATLKSEHAAGRKPSVSVFEAGGGTLRYEYVIDANLAAGDVIYIGDLPANNINPVDAFLISDDLDSGAGITMTAGILNAAKTAIGGGTNDLWIASTTIGQTGGVARPSNAAVALSGPSEFATRPLGVVIGAAAATPAMIGKKIIFVVDTTA